MKKSGIGGNQYLGYLWELGELPDYIYWWCWQFVSPDLLRSVHSENQGIFIDTSQDSCAKIVPWMKIASEVTVGAVASSLAMC